jgi:Xaa-Pro aminopeptidase
MPHQYTHAKIPFDQQERLKWLEVPFPIEEYHQRWERLRRLMHEHGFDALVVWQAGFDWTNIKYLAGFDNFWGTGLLIMPQDREPVLVTNAIFHGEPMHSSFHTTFIRDVRPVLHPHSTRRPENIGAVAGDVLHELGLATSALGVVGHVTIPAVIRDALVAKLPAATVKPADHLLAELRKIKSPREQDAFRRAGRYTDLGYAAAHKALRPGITEWEIMAASIAAMQAAGGERPGGGCQSGARTSLKNIGPSGRKVAENDLIFVDQGCAVGGYRVDSARNFVAGTPSPEIRKMLDVVLEQNEHLQRLIRPGAKISDLQKEMEAIAERTGLLDYDYTRYCFGHGGGLTYLEEPHFYWGNEERLEPGMTFYLEPMIIRHGVGTVCIEDVILVTDDGCESLTQYPRKTW